MAADASSIKPGEGFKAVAFITEIVAMGVDTTASEVEVAAVTTVDVMDGDIMIVDLIEAEEPVITVMKEVSVRHRGEILVLDYPQISL